MEIQVNAIKKNVEHANKACSTSSTNVGVKGFEPSTPCSQSRCANRTALRPENGYKYSTFFLLHNSLSSISISKTAKRANMVEIAILHPNFFNVYLFT